MIFQTSESLFELVYDDMILIPECVHCNLGNPQGRHLQNSIHPVQWLSQHVMKYIKVLTAYSTSTTLDSLLKHTDRRCLASDIQLMAKS
jgi:hypothetical protein